MTNQEALDVLRDMNMLLICSSNERLYKKCSPAIYVAIESVKRQIPQKPFEDPLEEGILFTRYKCPSCGCRRLGHGFDLDKCHCPECGQKLDWSETPW